MKIRTGDRVEWRRPGNAPRLVGNVVGFDNRAVVVADDRGGRHTVPARELTVVEKRTAST